VSKDAGSSAGIAGRYAAALFELADEENALETVERDLEALRASIDASPELQRVLRSPVVAREELSAAMAAILDKQGAAQLTKNVVGLMGENRRLFALRGLITAFMAKLAERRGEMTAEVASAVPLDGEQERRLRAEIEAALGKAVKLETRVEPALLGGLLVKVGSRMIDSTLRTKLNRMKTMMKEA